MQEFLFNPSLWMPAAAFGVAIAIFIYGNNRVSSTVRNAGLGLAGLVLVWCVAAFFVQTRVEQCVARTRAIVASVVAADWPRFTSQLDARTTLEFVNGNGAIARATQAAAERYGLKDIRILSTTALEGPGTVDVTFTALLEGVQPLTASFRFEYEQRADGILLSKIVPVRIGDRPIEDVRNAIR